MIKKAATLFTGMLFRPDSAIAGQLDQGAPSAPAAVLFAAYAAAGALISSLLPPAFIPEVPPEAFGRSYGVYLGVAISGGLLLNALVAAMLPRAAEFFSAGRAGPRVLLSITAVIVYFISFAAAADKPVLGAVLAMVPAAAALAVFLNRRDEFMPYFRLMLAVSAPALALAPIELLAIAAGSKPVYEAVMLAAAVWSVWLLVRALKSRGCPGTARAAAAAVSVLLLFSGMFYGLSLMLPGDIGPLLMLI